MATAQLTVTATNSDCPAAPYTNPTYRGTITAQTDTAQNYTGTFGFALASGGQVSNCNVTFVPVAAGGQTVATACTGTWSGSTLTISTARGLAASAASAPPSDTSETPSARTRRSRY